MAFALQSYATQTHIHIVKPSLSGSVSDIATLSRQAAGKNQSEPRDKYPANDDPANCPICQEIMHAGQYVTPSAIVFALPAETISVVPISLDAPLIVKAVSHGWRGRAPPQA